MRTREEPCSIDAEEVAEFLEAQRSPKRAELVRHLGRAARDAHLRQEELRQRCNRLVEQLWKYEGKPDTSVRDPQWTGD